jgi:hypothetical protein
MLQAPGATKHDLLGAPESVSTDIRRRAPP